MKKAGLLPNGEPMDPRAAKFGAASAVTAVSETTVATFGSGDAFVRDEDEVKTLME